MLPITSLGLQHTVSDERIGTGVVELDSMLGGRGVYRGSSVLISSTAGTGKTSLAATIAEASCRRGQPCLYFAFEESPHQLIRNLRSIGLDLQPSIDAGTLRVHASRPTFSGLEIHLSTMQRLVQKHQPAMVVVDPISNFVSAGTLNQAEQMLIRFVDFLKVHGTTAVFTNLSSLSNPVEATEVGISSVIDTWLLLRDIELSGERNRGIYILKSRGTGHSNQIREFLLTDHGIQLREVYLGPEGVLTGSARTAQEARERAAQTARGDEINRRRRELERKRIALEARISALRIEFEQDEDELKLLLADEELRDEQLLTDRDQMRFSRAVDRNGNRVSKRTRGAAGGDH